MDEAEEEEVEGGEGEDGGGHDAHELRGFLWVRWREMATVSRIMAVMYRREEEVGITPCVALASGVWSIEHCWMKECMSFSLQNVSISVLLS